MLFYVSKWTLLCSWKFDIFSSLSMDISTFSLFLHKFYLVSQDSYIFFFFLFIIIIFLLPSLRSHCLFCRSIFHPRFLFIIFCVHGCMSLRRAFLVNFSWSFSLCLLISSSKVIKAECKEIEILHPSKEYWKKKFH